MDIQQWTPNEQLQKEWFHDQSEEDLVCCVERMDSLSSYMLCGIKLVLCVGFIVATIIWTPWCLIPSLICGVN